MAVTIILVTALSVDRHYADETLPLLAAVFVYVLLPFMSACAIQWRELRGQVKQAPADGNKVEDRSLTFTLATIAAKTIMIAAIVFCLHFLVATIVLTPLLYP